MGDPLLLTSIYSYKLILVAVD